MVSFQGVHIIPTLLSWVGLAYASMVLFSLFGEKDYLGIKVKVGKKKRSKSLFPPVTTKGKLHLLVITVIVILIIFRPIKFSPMTDSHKEQVRASFDTAVYDDDGEYVETVRSGGYDVNKEVKKSVDNWDKVRTK